MLVRGRRIVPPHAVRQLGDGGPKHRGAAVRPLGHVLRKPLTCIFIQVIEHVSGPALDGLAGRGRFRAKRVVLPEEVLPLLLQAFLPACDRASDTSNSDGRWAPSAARYGGLASRRGRQHGAGAAAAHLPRVGVQIKQGAALDGRAGRGRLLLFSHGAPGGPLTAIAGVSYSLFARRNTPATDPIRDDILSFLRPSRSAAKAGSEGKGTARSTQRPARTLSRAGAARPPPSVPGEPQCEP